MNKQQKIIISSSSFIAGRDHGASGPWGFSLTSLMDDWSGHDLFAQKKQCANSATCYTLTICMHSTNAKQTHVTALCWVCSW